VLVSSFCGSGEDYKYLLPEQKAGLHKIIEPTTQKGNHSWKADCFSLFQGISRL
jgi:hypothetical protein